MRSGSHPHAFTNGGPQAKEKLDALLALKDTAKDASKALAMALTLAIIVVSSAKYP